MIHRLVLLGLLGVLPAFQDSAGPAIQLSHREGGKLQGLVTTRLPDGAVITIEFDRLEESFDGSRIVPRISRDVLRRFGMIQKGQASAIMTLEVASAYTVRAEFDPHVQSDEVKRALEKTPHTAFGIEAGAWSGASVEGLRNIRAAASALQEAHRIALGLLTQAERTLATPEAWKSGGESLLQELQKFPQRLERSEVIGFSASPDRLRRIIGDMEAYLRYAKYDDAGKLNVIDYHTGQPLKASDGQEFSFERMRSELGLVPALRRRELALFVPKILLPMCEQGAADPKLNEHIRSACGELLKFLEDVQGESDEALQQTLAFLKRIAAPQPPEEGETPPPAADPVAELRQLNELLRKIK